MTDILLSKEPKPETTFLKMHGVWLMFGKY